MIRNSPSGNADPSAWDPHLKKRTLNIDAQHLQFIPLSLCETRAATIASFLLLPFPFRILSTMDSAIIIRRYHHDAS